MENLKEFVNNICNPVIILKDSKIVLCNNQFIQIVNEDFTGKEITDVFHFNMNFSRIIQDIDSKKYRTASSNGHLFEFYISSYNSQDANFIVFLNEITHKSNEHSYLNIFKTFHLGYFKVFFENNTPKIEDIAPNIFSSIGMSNRTTDVFKFLDLFEENDRLKFFSFAKKIIDSKQDVTDFFFSPKIKNTGILDLYIRTYYKNENGVDSLLCVTLSLSDMNILASKVYNLETNFNDLFNNNLDAIYIIEGLNIITYNKNAEIAARKYNVRLKPNSNIFEFIVNKDLDNIVELLKDYNRIEKEIELVSGVKIYIEATVIPVLYNNKNCKALIAKDLTNQKNLMDEIKNVNSALKRFISIISHDLRTPFIQLKSLADIITDNYETFEKYELKKYVDLLDLSTENGLKLLDNLIQWSKIISSKISFEPVKTDISKVIEDAINFVSPNAKSKDISINFNKEEIYVFADKNMLGTIILNLLSNAVKFTNRAGKIDVRLSKNENNVVLSIKDNGIGMNKKTLNKLFTIDRYESSKGTEGETGTGLGLLIVSELVKKNNAKIYAESSEGNRTIFFVSFPIV